MGHQFVYSHTTMRAKRSQTLKSFNPVHLQNSMHNCTPSDFSIAITHRSSISISWYLVKSFNVIKTIIHILMMLFLKVKRLWFDKLQPVNTYVMFWFFTLDQLRGSTIAGADKGFGLKRRWSPFSNYFKLATQWQCMTITDFNFIVPLLSLSQNADEDFCLLWDICEPPWAWLGTGQFQITW